MLQVIAVSGAALEQLARPGGTIGAILTSPDAEFARLAIDVSGADLTGLTLALAPSGGVRGVVMLGEEPYRAGEGGATPAVVAVPMGPESLMVGPPRVPVAPDGTFAIRPLAGPYVLRLSGLPRGVAVARVEHAGRDVTDEGLVVPPGEEVSDVRVVLTSQPLRLAGRVDGGGATDVTVCRVVVFADEARRWTWAATRFIASVQPAASGAFELVGLPPGAYRAVAVTGLEPGEWRDAAVLQGLRGRRVPVRVESGLARPIELSCQSR